MAQQPPNGPPLPDTAGPRRDTVRLGGDPVGQVRDSGRLDTARPPAAVDPLRRSRPASRAAPARPSARPTLANLSNLHRKFIPVREGRIPIDSASLVPGAFFPKDVSDSDYTVDWVNATLSWKHPPKGADSILVVYRSLPYRLNAPARHFNYDSVENNFIAHPYVFNGGARSNDDNFFNFGNINYNGSFGRSITFGNSQDAVVTSNLNLQISGYLADSIEISAAITDNNIPIQPDGTTADLNEFDKIFLQFKKKTWALTMGDIDLRQNQNYFLNFYKRMQGASFETNNQISRNFSNKTLVSAAIAKGKFTRNIFQGQEGNQGPYKLQGANGELYFIVLAGTEKVYIDGQMMQRGEDQDYIINYNTAEITFTANRMITQDARIQVEFEYADRNYLNVNLYLYDEAVLSNKLKLRMGLFSNSDSRNSPINQSLTPDQDKFLNRLGDSINRAFYPVSTIDTFAAGKVLYKKVDTTYKNAAGVIVHDSIYVFSTDGSTTLYNLSFANVGAGYGNYVQDLNGVNGNVFLWVAPVNGQMQGSYEAAQFLVTPKTQRVMTAGAEYTPNKNTVLSAEVAKSHYDVNTLSSIDKANDDGYAARFLFSNSLPMGPAAKGRRLTTNLGYEYVQANFKPLERLRPVEFFRDWGLALNVAAATERIYNAGIMLSDKKLNSVRYDVARYQRGDGFTGMRHIVTVKQDIHGWRLSDQLSFTKSDSTNFSGYYLRPTFDVSKQLISLKHYVIGATYSMERNVDRDKQTDTVTATSFSFQTLQAYLRSPADKPDHWGLTFATRENSYPYGKSLLIGDRSRTFNLSADILKNPHHQFHLNATYRNLQIVRTGLTTQTQDNSLLGRAEYLVNEWKGLLRGNVLYEVGSGQEQKKNFTYLQVPAGTGLYAWIDVNKDGIQQLTEFVLAQFQDQAQYIRVYTPSNDYIKANYNTFNYSVTLNPRSVINPANDVPLHKLLARIILQSSMQLTQKQQAKGFVQLNPFKAPIDDTSLITRTMIVVNTFSFNRTDPRWGVDLTNTRNGAKTLLTYGYETRQLIEWMARIRMNISRSLALTTVFRQGTNQLSNTGQNFDSSNYHLRQWSSEPSLTYTRGANLRIGMGYKFSSKLNEPEFGGQKYTSGAYNVDFKYNIVQSTSIQSKFTYNEIAYKIKDGNASTTSSISYVILEGLLPGKNYLWNVDLTKKLGSSLELSLQYEGRKAGETRVVHTGRAALRALL
ncbi:hypothetical protein Q4E93_28995 [Flavitalea sp. BT771]|uniref:hypothetical protein n=1 Tax=Flavitalea sp. BT771 TaxID=3063329 RepID=UPI0026E1E031|nr:hypothetical protein [Flavitalea sp. BT771]MDO6434683.1 hypothetical protein [Flavitalea sp. BT771]MDV6223583.1 hypothetical protein [Flavitalea sp. BT771]